MLVSHENNIIPPNKRYQLSTIPEEPKTAEEPKKFEPTAEQQAILNYSDQEGYKFASISVMIDNG